LQASAGRLRLDVSLSTFARGYDELVDWRQLDAQHADQLRRVVSDELPTRNSGDATDYRQALQGAQRQLDERAEQLGQPSACKVVLWFTDGALDVDQATSTAARELCQVQGLADSVRADRISIVALALFTPGAGVTDAQRAQLRSVAEGSGAGVPCGTTPVASDASSGVYLSADDPTALRRLFAGAAALIGGDTEGPTAMCPSQDCPRGQFGFDVDAGVGGFRIVADVGSGAKAPSLLTPSGRTVRLPATGTDTTTIPEGRVEAFSRDGLTTVTMEAAAIPTKSSSWVVDLGPAGGDVDVYWSWRAQLSLSPVQIIAGRDATIQGTITGPDGTPIDPRLYRQLTISTAAGDRTIRTRTLTSGEFAADLPLTRDTIPTFIDVSVEAVAITRQAGIALAPLTYQDRVKVDLPPAFPAVNPDVLDLARLEVPGTRTATLDITGSDLGPTRVCLGDSVLQGPGGDTVDAKALGGDCVQLATGATAEMRIAITPTQSADGLVSGDLTLEMTGAQNNGTIDVTVPTRFDMTRAVDGGTRGLLVALLLGLSLLLPVLLLLLSEWLLARFAITPTHQIARVPVNLTESGPRRIDGLSQLLVSKDVTNLPSSRSARVRRFSVPGTDATFIVTRWWDVLRGARGVVEVPGGRLVASKVAPYSGCGGRCSNTGLGVLDAWFVVADSAAMLPHSGGNATLVTLFPTGYEPLADRADDIRQAPWESILAVLRDKAGAADTQSPSPASGGDPATASARDSGTDLPSWTDSTLGAAGLASAAAVPTWMSDGTDTETVPSTPATDSDSSRTSRWTSRARGAPPPPPPPRERPLTDDLPPIDFLK
jgi:hypothetical protein